MLLCSDEVYSALLVLLRISNVLHECFTIRAPQLRPKILNPQSAQLSRSLFSKGSFQHENIGTSGRSRFKHFLLNGGRYLLYSITNSSLIDLIGKFVFREVGATL